MLVKHRNKIKTGIQEGKIDRVNLYYLYCDLDIEDKCQGT
jgi:hypothetical protein